MSEQTTEFDQIITHLSNPLDEAKARLYGALATTLQVALLVGIVPLTWQLWTWAF